MWLLSTDRAELRYFTSPESVQEGYAILSHVWDDQEQTFQDVRALGERHSIAGNPRDYVSPKIKDSCILAQSHGYRWIWNDTCCIDKTSSAELSEAINSMFIYYSLADVCYAYMRDVSTGHALGAPNSEFRESRWHQRGWTLQELIAPRLLVFVSRDWQIIGTKTDLSGLLQEITSIPHELLRQVVSLPDIPVAERMSWAAQRATTRVEDQAYCLMGIFGINMPTLYGEGKQAFLRLQEEIMKHYPDTTLFAWGTCFHGRPDQLPSIDDPRYHYHNEQSYLFASSPAAFKDHVRTFFRPPDPEVTGDSPYTAAEHRGHLLSDNGITSHSPEEDEARSLAVEQVRVLSFSVTPYGVLAQVPVIRKNGLTIAVLFWLRGHHHLGLIIAPCPRSARAPLSYDIGLGGSPCYRLILLGHAVSDGRYRLFGETVSAYWSEIYLSHRPPPGMRANAVPTLPIPMCLGTSAPFRFRERDIERILKKFDILRFWPDHSPLDWTGFPPATFTFCDSTLSWGFALHLGRCIPGSRPPSLSAPLDSPGDSYSGEHWVYMQFYDVGQAEPQPFTPPEFHTCLEHHLSRWPNGSIAVDVPQSHPFFSIIRCHQLNLSFTQCPLNPIGTRVVSISVSERE